MPLHIEAVVRRGATDESRHRLHAVVTDRDGTVVAATERPDFVTTIRSAAKPFQLLPLVERGHADRWGFGPEHLALMSASHTGSRRHLEIVREILARIGVGEEALACGYHDPEDRESLADVFARSPGRSRLYNNCSGKHAGLLALARAEGWPVEGYERLEHPVQQLLRDTIADVCGVAPGTMGHGVDGCGLVVFSLPLSAMARGYARLATAVEQPGSDARGVALGRIGRAMLAHPRLVEGAGRTSTQLMEASRGRGIAKCGAEGLQLVGRVDRGLGLAVKCEDGAMRPLGPAVVAILEHLGWLSGEELERLADVRRLPVTNAAGSVVGSIEARVVASAAV